MEATGSLQDNHPAQRREETIHFLFGVVQAEPGPNRAAVSIEAKDFHGLPGVVVAFPDIDPSGSQLVGNSRRRHCLRDRGISVPRRVMVTGTFSQRPSHVAA